MPAISPNKLPAVDAAILLLFAFARQWPGATHHARYAPNARPAAQA
jgi:hypothetical protein